MRSRWLGALVPSLVLACSVDQGGLGSGMATVVVADSGTGTADDTATTAPTSAADAQGSVTSASTTQGDPSTGSTTSPPADCSEGNGGCDPNATCDDSSGGVVCTCNPGYQGDGQRCSVDASLPTLRVDLPCQPGECGSVYCPAVNDVVDMGPLSGNPAVTYAVTLWFRGVVEEKEYLGGMSDGFWNEGGTPNGDDWNVYSLTISDPPQSYFLNQGVAGVDHCEALDYMRTVPIRGGATVVLTMADANGCATVNIDDQGQPIVIPGIPPAPAPFDGQFLQVDAVDVVPQ